MARRGKIGRLPRAIREELNRRLQDGERAAALLEWLHAKPEVMAVLEREFAGARITPQNVSQWRAGGFAEWEIRQELLGQIEEQTAQAEEIKAVTKGRLTEQLATVVAARYSAVLANWNGEVTEEFGQKLKALHGVCQSITLMRRAEQSGTRLQMDQDQVARENENAEEAVVAHFQRWVRHPEVREAVCQSRANPEEGERRLRGVFGLTPEEASLENGDVGRRRQKKIQPNPS